MIPYYTHAVSLDISINIEEPCLPLTRACAWTENESAFSAT